MDIGRGATALSVPTGVRRTVKMYVGSSEDCFLTVESVGEKASRR
jgi:hypothetical protein